MTTTDAERPEENKSGNRGTTVQSVERAISILEFLARNGWSGVTELGDELGVHKSTAFRLLTTLQQRGLVEQHDESGLYHLGFGLVHLARAVTVGPDLTRRAKPGCEWLARRSEETVTLSVLDGDECVTVDQIISTSSVVSRSWLGRRTPLHCTSPGKVFLAFMPAARRRELLAGPLKRYTGNTIIDSEQLIEEIDVVRADDYATTVEELEEGLSSIAAPVRAADGTVIATIELSGPSYRLDDGQLADSVPLVREAAARASSRFGHSAPSPD